ncbi:MAG: hypothetical protein Q4B63_09740 [Clostridium perfringens]|nr:hypothetical protein [Clostridium perfringens]
MKVILTVFYLGIINYKTFKTFNKALVESQSIDLKVSSIVLNLEAPWIC